MSAAVRLREIMDRLDLKHGGVSTREWTDLNNELREVARQLLDELEQEVA